jgi:hypothetical protein
MAETLTLIQSLGNHTAGRGMTVKGANQMGLTALEIPPYRADDCDGEVWTVVCVKANDDPHPESDAKTPRSLKPMSAPSACSLPESEVSLPTAQPIVIDGVDIPEHVQPWHIWPKEQITADDDRASPERPRSAPAPCAWRGTPACARIRE